MMNRMQNVMRAHAVMAGQERAGTRMGVVSAYDPNSYSVKVQFPPANEDGTLPETGWLPLGTIGVGNNWGVVVGPSIGDQVEVEFQDGSGNAPVVPARFFSTQVVPPAVPSGEIWMVHAKGQIVKLTNGGTLILNDGQGGSVTLNGNGTVTSTGTWTHQGSLTVTGNLTVQGTVTGDQGASFVDDITISGKSVLNHDHTVPGVQGGSTTVTTNPMQN